MNTQKLTVCYAWQTPYGSGPTYETLEEAENQDRRDADETLLRLYVNAAGKVVHAEQVPA